MSDIYGELNVSLILHLRTV